MFLGRLVRTSQQITTRRSDMPTIHLSPFRDSYVDTRGDYEENYGFCSVGHTE